MDHWNDRVYGVIVIDDPLVRRLIQSPTMQRLRGVRQAGPSALAYEFKSVTRWEHSLGVYWLLKRLGASPQEQIAGLLHDVSHTAFSHAVDFVFASAEQDYHEKLKPLFLNRPDIAECLDLMGFCPSDFYDDAVYPLLERPLPGLCADRLDYFLRDGLSCGVLDALEVGEILSAIVVVDQMMMFQTQRAAALAVSRFRTMNQHWWASPAEAYIYNLFAETLRRALQQNILSKTDLLEADDWVLAKLRQSSDVEITSRLERIYRFADEPNIAKGYRPKIEPKQRWIDPPVWWNGQGVPTSRLCPSHDSFCAEAQESPNNSDLK